MLSLYPSSLPCSSPSSLLSGAHTNDGDNVLIIKLSHHQPLTAGSTFTYYYENDDLDGDSVSSFVDELKTYLASKNYSILNFNMDNNNVLDHSDSDKNGDGKVPIASCKDYSPLRETIQLWLGNPGYPAGARKRTVVQT
jgi:hypothetical protein